MIKRFILFLIVGLFLFPGSAFALRMNNPKLAVTLSPGESYNGSITLENPSDKPVSIRVYLEDFKYTSPFDGSKEFFSPGALENSLSGMVSFSPQSFVMNPNSKQTVNFTIDADKNLEGVYCGVLFFESGIGVTQDEQGQAVNVLGRLGSLIFVQAENRNKKAVFEDIKIQEQKLTGKFTNTGNTFIHMLEGTYYIIDDIGMVSDRGQARELYLLPQDAADLEIDLSVISADAKEYTAVFTFDLEDGEVVIKEVDFIRDALGNMKILDIRD